MVLETTPTVQTVKAGASAAGADKDFNELGVTDDEIFKFSSRVW